MDLEVAVSSIRYIVLLNEIDNIICLLPVG